jgi:hypothetical protein
MLQQTGTPLTFNKWKAELLKEDKDYWYGEVSRPPKAYAQLYQIYLKSFKTTS